MSSFTTYNNIIARFELFANNHLQIKRFSQGNISVADLEKDGDYPVLHVVPGTFAADQQYQYGVDVYVFDKPRDKDEFSKSDYQREVISDCAQILNDVIADMTNGGNVFLYDEGWQVELPVSITPFIQEQQHVVTGVQASLNINLPWGLDACELPLIPITPSPPVVCLDATVEINGVELNTIASGGTLNVTVQYENLTPVGTLSGGDTVTIPNPSACDDATVENSDQSYTDTVASGATLVLPDTTYNFYLDGVLVDTQTIPSIKTETFNIVWQ